MKKLLVVHNFYQNFGGEDSNIYEELEILGKEYEVEFFSVQNGNENILFSLLALITRSNYKVNNDLRKLVDSFKPDVVYIHNIWFTINLGIFKVLKKRKIKVLLKIHNFRYECSRYFFSKNHLNEQLTCNACGFNKDDTLFFNKYFPDSYLKSILLCFFSKKYFKILKYYPLSIIAINNFHQSKMLSIGIPKEKITVLNNPIRLNNEFVFKRDKTIIYAGRLSEEKGLKELISSWTEARLKDYELLIIGDGDLNDYLKNKYNNHNISFLGFLPNDEVKQYISKASAVVTATKLYEGQPRLLCEASALGTLSIYPSFGGMDEFFPEGYQFSFKQFDYKDLREKLTLIQDDDAVTKSTKALLKHTNDIFDPTRLFANFDKLFEKNS